MDIPGRTVFMIKLVLVADAIALTLSAIARARNLLISYGYSYHQPQTVFHSKIFNEIKMISL